MYPLRWFSALPPSWTRVTWFVVLTSMKAISTNYNWRLDDFTNIEKRFAFMVCARQASPFHDNTLSLTIRIKSENSAPQLAFVLPSPSHDTSRPSSDHGDDLTGTTLWAKCCSRTNASTNSKRHAMILCIEGCSLQPMVPRQNLC